MATDDHGAESVAVLPGADVDHAAAAELFKALSNPIRIRLVELIRRAPEDEVCFCDLAEEFDIPDSSLSHHLKTLVAAGILSRERRGTWSWYRIEHGPLDVLEGLIRPGGALRAG